MHRLLLPLGIALCITTLFAGETKAGHHTRPPDGFPECRRGIEGTWYSIGWLDDRSEWSDLVRIDGDMIWWSFVDQTPRMSLIESHEVRHLFSLEKPLIQYHNGEPLWVINYVVIENPMGWAGYWGDDIVWPCAITITFCRQRWVAEEIMTGKPIDIALASEGCPPGNFVPYKPAPTINP